MDTILGTQPLTYGQIIKRSLVLYCFSFFKVILLALLTSLVIFIPRILSDIAGQELFTNLPPLSPHRLWITLINLISLGFFVAIIWHMHCMISQVHEPLKEDITIGAKKAVYVFVAAIILNVIIFALLAIIFGLEILFYQHNLLFSKSIISVLLTGLIFIGQFILLLYISVLFIFFIPLIAIENKGIFAAIEKSVLLTWNHWWRVFSVQITPWICYVILLFVVKYGLNVDIHIYFVEQVSHPLWPSLLNITIFTLYIPWVAALLVIQLKDIELRRNLSYKK